MTAEAIVMNRSAIALAADSAVTIRGPGASKTFDTANKLFELIKGSNVGVMVYNSMLLNGTPWETIIKAYRNEHSDFSAPAVTDYLDHFLKFLSDSVKLLKPEDDHNGAIGVAYDGLIPVAKQLERRYAEFTTAKGRLIKTKVNTVLTEICDKWESQISAQPDMPAASHLSPAAVKNEYFNSVKEIVEFIFDNFDLRQSLINRMTNLALHSLLKQGRNPSDSGLVFAGFGKEEYFPSYVSTRVTARLLGHVISRAADLVAIDVDSPGFIQTFAQDEPALGWITGISSQTRARISNHWNDWVLRELPRGLRKAIPSSTISNQQRNTITSEVMKLAKDQLNNFFAYMDSYEQQEFIMPMFESVAALPKDELGLLAESLVNITSLKQRMSVHQSNTVGGAIDVALISIGDGFVWLNRKHYFEEHLNPTWHLTHGAKIITKDGV